MEFLVWIVLIGFGIYIVNNIYETFKKSLKSVRRKEEKTKYLF